MSGPDDDERLTDDRGLGDRGTGGPITRIKGWVSEMSREQIAALRQLSAMPGTRKNWERAVIEACSKRYRKKFKTFEEAQKAFQQKLDSFDTERSRKTERGREKAARRRRKHARSMFDRVRKRFNRLEAKNPSNAYPLTPRKKGKWEERSRMRLKKGNAFDPRVQIEHIDRLSDNPKRALDPANLRWTEGDPGGTQSKGTVHYKDEAERRAKEAAERGTADGKPTPKDRGTGSKPKKTKTKIPRKAAEALRGLRKMANRATAATARAGAKATTKLMRAAKLASSGLRLLSWYDAIMQFIDVRNMALTKLTDGVFILDGEYEKAKEAQAEATALRDEVTRYADHVTELANYVWELIDAQDYESAHELTEDVADAMYELYKLGEGIAEFEKGVSEWATGVAARRHAAEQLATTVGGQILMTVGHGTTAGVLTAIALADDLQLVGGSLETALRIIGTEGATVSALYGDLETLFDTTASPPYADAHSVSVDPYNFQVVPRDD